MSPETILFAVLTGLLLGMIGGGGSILTVPVLVYAIGIAPVMATAYSLFIIGATSMVGVFRLSRLGSIDYKTALIFGGPSIFAVFVARRYILPAIHDPVFHLGTHTISKGGFIMCLFALLMFIAATSMIFPFKPISQAGQKKSTLIMLSEGMFIGLFTGMVGAGGGFLIIPSLVILRNLGMKIAVGTSLFIIAVNSFIGVISNINVLADFDWSLILSFTTFAVTGMFVGIELSKVVSAIKLKTAFGWFTLLMGILIIMKEIYLNHI